MLWSSRGPRAAQAPFRRRCRAQEWSGGDSRRSEAVGRVPPGLPFQVRGSLQTVLSLAAAGAGRPELLSRCCSTRSRTRRTSSAARRWCSTWAPLAEQPPIDLAAAGRASAPAAADAGRASRTARRRGTRPRSPRASPCSAPAAAPRAGGRAAGPRPRAAPVAPWQPPRRAAARPSVIARARARRPADRRPTATSIVTATGQRRGRARGRPATSTSTAPCAAAPSPASRATRARMIFCDQLEAELLSIAGRAPGQRGDRPEALAPARARRARARAAGDPRVVLSPRRAAWLAPARGGEFGEGHRRHVGQGRGRQDHLRGRHRHRPGAARQEDRRDRLRRRPAQPRPDHGLRAPGRVRLHQRHQRRHPPATRR